MLSANQVKELLSKQDIFDILNELGGEPKFHKSVIISKTICHNGSHKGKEKLIYYPDKKIFRCYTECGNFDIFKLVSSVLNLDFINSFKYICNKFNLYSKSDNYEFEYIDNSFFNKFYKESEKIELSILPNYYLKSFYQIYHKSWIKDGISIEAMKKFNIHFSIKNNQIIIPHYDINNNLIGIRARNLNENLVNEGKKYVPIFYKNKILSYPTGANLYGLNINKDNIKKYKTIILVEAEKSVLQSESMFFNKSIAVALSGSSLSSYQVNLIKNLNIENCIIALDKEYKNNDSIEEEFYKNKIYLTIISKLIPYFNISVIWDIDNLLSYKDSPLDKGKEVFEKLLNQKIEINE